ncbi:GNAT family N-acetyltransferase [Aurantibacter sp.]|uniref:GNAT family N-acetyltransferase n=1 Tax=Aurantibacter sp. TaxID=2807103 RepID=UPI0035C7EB96
MRKATAADKQLVSEILVSAFSPLEESSAINLVVKQDKKRIKRMLILMEYLFETAMLFGEIYISDNNKACLLLKYPLNEKVTLKTIGLDIKLAFKCIGLERVFGVLKRQRITKKHAPKEHYIRPMILGSKNDSIGKGTAARLMMEVRLKFKDNKLPVITDAASEDNAKMYQKFGFRITKTDESLGFPIYFLRLN